MKYFGCMSLALCLLVIISVCTSADYRGVTTRYEERYRAGFDRGYSAATTAIRNNDNLERWLRDWSKGESLMLPL